MCSANAQHALRRPASAATDSFIVMAANLARAGATWTRIHPHAAAALSHSSALDFDD